MSAGSELQTYALTNITANDLIDTAEELRLGSCGRDFQWHPACKLVVAFNDSSEALLFKLAYRGSGLWAKDQLIAPTTERAILERIILHHNLSSSGIVELVRVWLPSANEHTRLTEELNKKAPGSAITL